MVQKATQAAYLDMVSFQSQGSKVSGSGDKKSSFSQALDKEMTQDKPPVENDKSEKADKAEEQPKAESEKPEETQQPEAEQITNDKAQEESQQKENMEDSVAVQLAAQLQQLQIQQSTQAQQVTEVPVEVVSETETQQAVSTLAAEAVTDEQNVRIQQTEGENVQAVIVEEDAEQTQQIQRVDTATDAETAAARDAETATATDAATGVQKKAETKQIQTVVKTVKSADTQVQQSMQHEQPLQNNQQTETQISAGTSEAASQTVQGQVQQTVSVVQQPVQTQTVNMSQPQQGMQNLANTMAENIKQGANEFEIWLEPANLGKIGVKVAYEGGRAMISIMCMSDKAMEIIAQNSKTLGAIIQQNTGTNTIVVVDQPERQDYLQQESQKQRREDQQQEDQQENRGSNEEDAETQSFLQQLRLGLK